MKRGWSRSKRVVVLLVVVSALLIIGSYYRTGALAPLSFARNTMRGIAWNSARAVEAVIAPVRSGLGDVAHFWRLRNENARLKARLTSLRGELLTARGVAEENSRLRRAARFLPRIPVNVVGAYLLQRSGNPWESVVLVDRGRADGVKIGAPVMGDGGVIGQVTSISEHLSEVRLLDDQRSGIAVEIERTGGQGIVTGSVGGSIRLRYQPTDADIKKGDRLITSGAGSAFPRGLDVGRVSAIDQGSYGLERNITVKPTASLRHISVMFVGTNKTFDDRAFRPQASVR